MLKLKWIHLECFAKRHGFKAHRDKGTEGIAACKGKRELVVK